MMIHSETGTKALCVNMFLLLFLRDLGYVTNAIQLQRLNKQNDIFFSDSENVLEKVTVVIKQNFQHFGK